VQLSLSRAWEESRRIFARDGGLVSAVALAMLVLPQILVGVVAPATQSSPSLGGRILGLIAALVGVIGQLAIVRLALGPSTTVGQAIAHGARRFPAMVGALILLMLALGAILIPVMAALMAAGLVQVPQAGEDPGQAFTVIAMVLAVACILIAVRFMMTVPVASAEDAGPVSIIKRSWRLTSGRYWPLLGLEMLLLVAAVFLLLAAQLVGGVVAEIVGGNATPFSLSALILAAVVAAAQAAFTVLASVMLARVYLQLHGAADAPASVPTSGT
jgi:hypothetical protein